MPEIRCMCWIHWEYFVSVSPVQLDRQHDRIDTVKEVCAVLQNLLLLLSQMRKIVIAGETADLNLSFAHSPVIIAAALGAHLTGIAHIAADTGEQLQRFPETVLRFKHTAQQHTLRIVTPVRHLNGKPKRREQRRHLLIISVDGLFGTLVRVILPLQHQAQVKVFFAVTVSVPADLLCDGIDLVVLQKMGISPSNIKLPS